MPKLATPKRPPTLGQVNISCTLHNTEDSKNKSTLLQATIATKLGNNTQQNAPHIKVNTLYGFFFIRFKRGKNKFTMKMMATLGAASGKWQASEGLGKFCVSIRGFRRVSSDDLLNYKVMAHALLRMCAQAY